MKKRFLALALGTLAFGVTLGGVKMGFGHQDAMMVKAAEDQPAETVCQTLTFPDENQKNNAVTTYKNEWNSWVYIIGVISIFVVSMLLQHIFKFFRFLYGLFTCVVVSVMGTVFIGYDCEKRMYTIMAVCFGVTALLGFISWKCHIEK